MANSPLPSNAMTVRLSDPAYWHEYKKPLTLFHDLPPCDIAAPKTEVICIVCQKPGSLRCSRCHDAEYCSTDCQYGDWDTHKLICEKLSSFSSEPRPSKDHFRVLVFPYQASSPEFCWGVFKKHEADYEVDELIIVHSTIDSWKAANEGQYTGPYEWFMRVRALSRDSATHGKILGHAVRIASYKSSHKLHSHLRGFNETVLTLAGPLSKRFYGPLVALAYNLDSRSHFETMDDISSADFGALVDVFHKSDWNPTVGHVEGYPKKTVSALFLPDVFNFHRMYSSRPETTSESPDELSIRRLIGAQDSVVEVNIAATLDSKQLCSHSSCDFDAISIKELCLNGDIFHTLLLGPLLLDLPWIGRIALFTDDQIDTPEYRWQESRCRFLRRGIALCYKSLSIEHVPERDGIIVFSAFGVKISPLHLIAYDEFMFRQLQTEKSKRQLSKAGFLSFWSDLKSGKVKITNELKTPQYSHLNLLEFWGDSRPRETQTMTHAELDFSEESSPYDTPTDAKYILTEDETQVFLHIRKLFRDPDFVRPNQRDWLEVLYDANTLVQDRKLGPDYWADELDRFFTDYLSSLAQD